MTRSNWTAPSRAPLFVFFPTISTHIPFSPTPPYQPDWPRMLTPQPYETADVNRAFSKWPDWLNLGPSYTDALVIPYESIAGYLRQHADRDFVMVVLGDHQPAAAVSGEGAPWDVPVHIIASRAAGARSALAHGFRRDSRPRARSWVACISCCRCCWTRSVTDKGAEVRRFRRCLGATS